MEISSSFTQFLQENAIFSQRQAQKFSTELATDDESLNICKLADFFTALTPSDCYDLALRLYSLWQKGPKVSAPPSERKEKETTSATNTINKAPQPAQSNLKKPKNGILKDSNKMIVTSPSVKDNNRSISPERSECETKSSNNYNSNMSDSVFNYLHNEAHRKKSIKLENEQRKMLHETDGCTFQPNISKYHSVSGDSNVFKRLQQDLRKEKLEMNEAVKSHLEMQGCSFTPTILRRPLAEEDDMRASSTSLNRTFDRLHKEFEAKKHLTIENEIKRKTLEVRDCTFQPALSVKSGRSPSRSQDRFNDLYKLHSERQRSLVRKRIEQSEDEKKKCTFKPQVWSSPKNRDNSKGVHERLLRWNTEKNLKLEMKVKEKISIEENMSQELNLPASRKNDMNDSRMSSSAYERLYQDNAYRQVRKQELEKQVMKDIGASFRPRTNKNSVSSGQKLRENANLDGIYDPNLSYSRDEDVRMPRPQRSFQLNDRDGSLSSQYRKNFLEEAHQNHFVNSERKTMTFGYNGK